MILIIVIVIFLVIWYVYGFALSQNKIIDVPMSIKCLIETNNCEAGDINMWTLIRAGMFGVIGYLFPGHYILVIVVSVIMEYFEPVVGINANFIINPLANLTAYTIGSLLSDKEGGLVCEYQTKYQVVMNNE